MTEPSARGVALRSLASARERSAYIGPVIEGALSRTALTEPDRAFAVRLARGVTETLGVLDDVLNERLDRPSRVEPRVRDALRMAAYELLYLSAKPHAVVHEYVDLVRSLRPQATGMANAVLRRLAEAAPEFPWGDPETDLAALARVTGHPLWLAELIIGDLGAERGRAVLFADTTPAPVYVRVNPFRATPPDAVALLNADGARPEPAPPDAFALVVREPRSALRGETVAHGAVLVTDAAAQVAPLAIGPHPRGRILDACAGRGTKTVALQAISVAAGAPADLVALDIHESKTELLAVRMAQLGIPSVTAVTGDLLADDLVEAVGEQPFDAVLVDAPCSGIGTLRRNPELRWRLTPHDVPRLATLQSSLLARAGSLVRPGGCVVYSTCSVTHAETVGVVEMFLASPEGSAYCIDPITGLVPQEWRRFVTPRGYFASWPEEGGPDGHFVARLVRQAR